MAERNKLYCCFSSLVVDFVVICNSATQQHTFSSFNLKWYFGMDYLCKMESISLFYIYTCKYEFI